MTTETETVTLRDTGGATNSAPRKGNMKINVSNEDSFYIVRPVHGTFFWNLVDERIIEFMRSEESDYQHAQFHIEHFIDRFGNYRARVVLDEKESA